MKVVKDHPNSKTNKQKSSQPSFQINEPKQRENWKWNFHGIYERVSYCYNWQYPLIVLCLVSYAQVKNKHLEVAKIMHKMNKYVLPIQFVTTIINTFLYHWLWKKL